MTDLPDIVKAYMRLFDSEDGQTVLKHMASSCSVLGGTYSDDPHKMYYKEGRRSVVYDIFDYVEMDLNKYRKLYEEEE